MDTPTHKDMIANFEKEARTESEQQTFFFLGGGDSKIPRSVNGTKKEYVIQLAGTNKENSGLLHIMYEQHK